MEIKTETVRTYWVSMTETQARDLLRLATMDPDFVQIDIRDHSIDETLNTIRQALLTAGISKDPS